MNKCCMCMYVDANVAGAPFMFVGSSYCKRHLIIAMSAIDSPSEVPSDASKVKWEDDN